MKKIMLTLAMTLTAICANAFDFDGISLSENAAKISKEISKRGYVYDDSRDCLKGNCRGTEIYLSLNTSDVTEKGKLGQLIIEIPNNDANAGFDHIRSAFNVIYHVVAEGNGVSTYAVDTDGTQLVITKKEGAIILTYNTPYYQR